MAAIIYANTMFFEGDCSLDELLGVVARWLNDSRKTGGRFDAVGLTKNNTLAFADHQQVQTWASDDTYPQLYAIRYSHPDRDISGRPIFRREWVTEVGFRRAYSSNEIECSVLLRTEDDSPNSNVPEVSRPNLVLDLVRSCPLIPDVEGLSLTHLTVLDENIMDGLRDFVIDSTERRRPLVVISPTTSGEYLVNAEKLSNLLVGLASVIIICISQIFSNRLVVLDSAWRSARRSEDFYYPHEVFKMLWKLAFDYWNKLAGGFGDNEARSVFGKNEYSAKESETVLNNQRARELRTFDYDGQQLLMEKHLKFGVKDSAFETMRIHFEWDNENKKIVIGHCGPHLDFK